MTAAPSDDRVRHAEAIEAPRVDSTTFRQGWRVTTRLDALLADGSITFGQWQAACEYRDCCVSLSAGPSGPGSERTNGGADVHARQIALLYAAARVRAVDRALGHATASLCHAVVVLDRSWRDLGLSLGCHRLTARRVAVQALQALSAAWSGIASDAV
jgi:hypothetical protein